MTMRFKQFLEQAPHGVRTLEVDLDDVVKFFKENPVSYRNLLKEAEIYRGMGQAEVPYQYGDSRTFIRQSPNTHNYVNLFISNAPNWRHLPKRNQSFVGSTKSGNASGYGIKYVMFPADEAKIAVCGEADFWNVFKYNIDGMNQLLHRINFDLENKLSENDPKKLRAQLTALTPEELSGIKDAIAKHAAVQLENQMEMEDVGNVAALFDKIFDPKEREIEETTTGGIAEMVAKYPGNECWVEGRVLFVRHGNEGKIFDVLRKQIIEAMK